VRQRARMYPSRQFGCAAAVIVSEMQYDNKKTTIELGMKVSVRRSGQNHIGVVTRVEGDYVVVRWTHSDFAETAEYQAHRDEVTPLAGWL
jgi:FKBP-type peptidyl-prolyl cis-trans isomerase 2